MGHLTVCQVVNAVDSCLATRTVRVQLRHGPRNLLLLCEHLHLHIVATGVACRLALLSDRHALLVLRSLMQAGDRILKGTWTIRLHLMSVPALGRLRPVVPNLVLLVSKIVEAAIRVADRMSM